MEAIHERFFENTQCYVAIFSEEEKLYQMIKRECKVKLIPYSNRISLALLTQLFPVLEIKIRELAKLLGVFRLKRAKKNLCSIMIQVHCFGKFWEGYMKRSKVLKMYRI